MIVKNNYNECLTNLACSIRKYFELDYKHNTLDYIDKVLDEDRTVEKYKEMLKECYEVLPPVTPNQKMGHWVYDYISADGHKTYHCSECGCYLKPKHSEPLNSFKWCSLCGAKMIEPQDKTKQGLAYADQDTLMSAT